MPKMLRIEVVELKEDQYAAWDHLVENSPQGTIFHTSAWLATCGKLLNQKVKLLGCLHAGRLIAGCPFFAHTIFGLARLAYSISGMTPFGGVVLAQPTTSRNRQQENLSMKIIGSLCQSIAAYHFDHVQLTNSPALVDVRPFTWNGWSSKVRYAYYADTDVEFETHVNPKAMSHIRRAIKSGIAARKSEDVSAYCRLFLMTFQRQGIEPPVTESFLAHIFDLLKSRSWGEMWIAETASGEIACAEILVWDSKRAYAWSAASDTQLRKTGATSLLLYREFEELKRRGVKEYSLMSANIPSLASFNSSFNPRLVSYYEVEKSTLKFRIAREAAIASRRLFRRRTFSC